MQKRFSLFNCKHDNTVEAHFENESFSRKALSESIIRCSRTSGPMAAVTLINRKRLTKTIVVAKKWGKDRKSHCESSMNESCFPNHRRCRIFVCVCALLFCILMNPPLNGTGKWEVFLLCFILCLYWRRNERERD